MHVCMCVCVCLSVCVCACRVSPFWAWCPSWSPHSPPFLVYDTNAVAFWGIRLHLRAIVCILAPVNVKRVLDDKGRGQLSGLRPRALAVVQHPPLARAHVEGPHRGVNHLLARLYAPPHQDLVANGSRHKVFAATLGPLRLGLCALPLLLTQHRPGTRRQQDRVTAMRLRVFAVAGILCARLRADEGELPAGAVKPPHTAVVDIVGAAPAPQPQASPEPHEACPPAAGGLPASASAAM